MTREESISRLSSPVGLSQHHTVTNKYSLEVELPIGDNGVNILKNLISKLRNIHATIGLS